MEFTRRSAIAMGAGAFAALSLPKLAVAAAGDDAIAAFTGGAQMADTGVTLTAPEIAENGNTVPIEVDAPGATEIMVLALGNPTPPVANFKFGPLAATQHASTRIRLAGTQDVVAIAKLADGSFAKATSSAASIRVAPGSPPAPRRSRRLRASSTRTSTCSCPSVARSTRAPLRRSATPAATSP